MGLGLGDCCVLTVCVVKVKLERLVFPVPSARTEPLGRTRSDVLEAASAHHKLGRFCSGREREAVITKAADFQAQLFRCGNFGKCFGGIETLGTNPNSDDGAPETGTIVPSFFFSGHSAFQTLWNYKGRDARGAWLTTPVAVQLGILQGFDNCVKQAMALGFRGPNFIDVQMPRQTGAESKSWITLGAGLDTGLDILDIRGQLAWEAREGLPRLKRGSLSHESTFTVDTTVVHRAWAAIGAKESSTVCGFNCWCRDDSSRGNAAVCRSGPTLGPSHGTYGDHSFPGISPRKSF
ncbi:hypothetical protein B0I37DRAFT_400582 [Chaetomium sp. MPI-CAGE-AT-0009]|nr:hypothetical protein B0I37DRAFT_400582 [Chaetomium sp. MPI-CAGE-AT-0009]